MFNQDSHNLANKTHTGNLERNAKKAQLQTLLHTLHQQVWAAQDQLNKIIREEEAEAATVRKEKRAQDYKEFTVKLKDRESLKKKLEKLPPSHLNKIYGEEAISWACAVCDLGSWGLLTSQDKEMLRFQFQGIICEIREERKNAWLKK
jgi:hypothetical protein